ncbi:MAG: hypothetical protein WKF37_03355 [Bryobacteraceae bacterium]
MNAPHRVEKLQRTHPIESFDCGQEALNRFLIRYALQNQQAEASQTYVALDGENVIGFYTLVVGQIDYADAPERLTRGWPAIRCRSCCWPALRLRFPGARGIGSGLLKDAMLRTLQAADRPSRICRSCQGRAGAGLL